MVSDRSTIYRLKTGKVTKLDPYLYEQLDSLVWNINNDWDFVVLVTGDGSVRTGKSVLTLNAAAYCADRIGTPFTLKDNVFFEGQALINAGLESPENTVFVYDEAREGLATAKRFNQIQQLLVDFFNECGQKNHLFFLVLPDFFSLNWELATNRSECLINVYREADCVERYINKENRRIGKKSPIVVFKRGQFAFFNRDRKAQLYWKVKKSAVRNYQLVPPNFIGRFSNNYPVDEEEYRNMKRQALERFNSNHRDKMAGKKDLLLPKVIDYFKQQGMPGSKISEILGIDMDHSISERHVNRLYREYKNGQPEGQVKSITEVKTNISTKMNGG